MSKRIYLSSPTMHGEEMQFIKEAFEANWIAPLGKNVDEFEKEIASYIGVRDAAALSSGTAALHLAVKLAGVERDDVVICSDLTFSATVNPVSYEGGRQVFVDSDRESWNMDSQALEDALKKYPEAKALICANLYGTPAKLDDISFLCDKYNVTLIEDAAESLGAIYNGKQTGSFGRYSALSFNGNKVITTSGGGMLLSSDEDAIKKARFWATQSRDAAPWYQHSEIGYNYRMSNIVAGIGRGQLLHLDEHVARKREIYAYYKNAFSGLPLQMNPCPEKGNSSRWLSCALIDEKSPVRPAGLIAALSAENIEARHIWKPMHLQPVFADRDFISSGDDVGADIFTRGVCLPSDIKMTEEELEKVSSIVKGLF